VSDSEWHRRLSRLGGAESEAYWLGPFENSKTNCPYLVGAYEDVARELAVYLKAGYSTCILDIPPSEEELDHIRFVFDIAGRNAL
jgi:alkanesulfonate monooxygenase